MKFQYRGAHTVIQTASRETQKNAHHLETRIRGPIQVTLINLNLLRDLQCPKLWKQQLKGSSSRVFWTIRKWVVGYQVDEEDHDQPKFCCEAHLSHNPT